MRVVAAVGVIAVAAALVTYAVPVMIASWLVDPTPYAAVATPTRDLGRVQRAAALAPGEPRYAHFEAQLQRDAMRASWLQTDAARRHGESAARAADRAVALAPKNPFFLMLRGTIDLERARVPGTAAPEAEALTAAGLATLGRALANSPASPMVQQAYGLEMVGAWPALDASTRQSAIQALRRAAAAERDLLVNSMAAIWAKVPADERASVLTSVVPEQPDAHRAAAMFVRARIDDPGVPAERRAELTEVWSEQLLLAAVAEDLSMIRLDAWFAAQREIAGEDLAELAERIGLLVTEHPERPEPRLLLARVHGLAGRSTESAAALEEAVSRAESNGTSAVRVRALAERAAFFADSGDLERARIDYEQALTLTPDDEILQRRLGRLLDRLGLSDEALNAFQAAVRAAPRSIDARRELAQAHAKRFDYLEAVAQWRVIASARPDSPEPRVEIARLYVAIGVREQAVRFFTEALEIDPDNATARRELDALLRNQR